MRVVAIIPAKSHSARVPNKNMRLFNGKPLLFYTIEQALKSKLIDEVYVSTESPEIKAFSETCGAKVPFLRPAELCHDHVHSVVPILHMLEQLDAADVYGYCVHLLPTNPLRTVRSIDSIVALSKEHKATVLSVTPFGKTLHHLRTMLPDGSLARVTSDVVHNVQTQDFPELFYLNGAIYCAPVVELLKYRTYHHGNPLGYVMDTIEAFDIDTETDFLIAETLASVISRSLRA